MSSKEYNSLIKIIDKLSPEERASLVKKVMSVMDDTSSVEDRSNCNDLVHKFSGNHKPDCPHCKATGELGYIIKKGFVKKVQRYYCKACGRYFLPSTNTAFARTRKGSDVWEKFIELTISGKSLHVCAEECNICYDTAFTWRHKVLNAFKKHQESATLAGRIEIDEMLWPISYKGNHVKGRFDEPRYADPYSLNNLPRKAHKRGSDNKSYAHKDKACIFCMIKNGNEFFWAGVPGVGYMQESMLDKSLAVHVDKENSFILADKYKKTARYLADNDYNFKTLLSNTSNNRNGHKPEIDGDDHIQHVNAFHMHLRRFLRPYNGVSTKYLENYVSLYVWLKNIQANKQRKLLQKHSVKRMAKSDCYITRKGLVTLPAVPSCA